MRVGGGSELWTAGWPGPERQVPGQQPQQGGADQHHHDSEAISEAYLNTRGSELWTAGWPGPERQVPVNGDDGQALHGHTQGEVAGDFQHIFLSSKLTWPAATDLSMFWFVVQDQCTDRKYCSTAVQQSKIQQRKIWLD